jgi:hypothetical protein
VNADVLLDCRACEPPDLPVFKMERGGYVPLHPLTEDDIISVAKKLLRLRIELEGVSPPEAPDEAPAYNDPVQGDLADWLKLYFSDLLDEKLLVAYLDPQCRLVTVELHSSGGLSETSISPRRLIRRVLDLNAGAVILAHNIRGEIPRQARKTKR